VSSSGVNYASSYNVFAESFSRPQASYLHVDIEVDRNGRLTMTIAIYLIAAAVVVCSCLFLVARVRSRD
jgi:hypothetical protein